MKKTALFGISLMLLLSLMAGSVFAASEPQTKSRDLISSGAPEEIFLETESVPENGLLLEQYIESEFSSEALNAAEESALYRLSENDYITFSSLKEKLSAIADGKTNSTVVELTAGEMGLKGVKWTAEDLGVESLGARDSGFTPEAEERAKVKGVDLGLVIKTLLMTCPYELYWFDKTESGGCVQSVVLGGSVSKESGEVTEIYVKSATVKFSVAADFAVGGTTGTYEIDPSTTGRVVSAVENVRAIVSENEDLSDYLKLKAYKDEIITLASYDKTASDEGATYGNAWQMISVFDGDPETNVVCEGYAKAFQYLCDLSTFQSDQVSARLVTGTVSGKNSTNTHMWNLVTMDDGETYVADITNSDEGFVGSGEQLFLKGLSGQEPMASAASDYTILCSEDNGLTYRYDDWTLAVYAEEDLLVSNGAYDSNADYSREDPAEDPTEEDPAEDPTVEDPTEEEPADDPTEEDPSDKEEDPAYNEIGTIQLSSEEFTYNGEVQKPEVIVKDTTGKLLDESAYKLGYVFEDTYSEAGVHFIIVDYLDDVSKTKVVSYKINPLGSSIVKLANTSKGVRVKWDKLSDRISGYQIEYSPDRSFESGVKTVTVNNSEAAAKTITGLKSRKTYYVRVRTFLDDKLQTCYSEWSSIRKVKVK